MNLADHYCTVAEACALAGVSKSYLYAMIGAGRIEAQRFGRGYAVLRSSVAKFERQPGMGRPTAKPAARRKARRRQE